MDLNFSFRHLTIFHNWLSTKRPTHTSSCAPHNCSSCKPVEVPPLAHVSTCPPGHSQRPGLTPWLPLVEGHGVEHQMRQRRPLIREPRETHQHRDLGRTFGKSCRNRQTGKIFLNELQEHSYVCYFHFVSQLKPLFLINKRETRQRT